MDVANARSATTACVCADRARVSRSYAVSVGPVVGLAGYVVSALIPKPIPTPAAAIATPPITNTIGDGVCVTAVAARLAELAGAAADDDADAAARSWRSAFRFFFAPWRRFTITSA